MTNTVQEPREAPFIGPDDVDLPVICSWCDDVATGWAGHTRRHPRIPSCGKPYHGVSYFATTAPKCAYCNGFLRDGARSDSRACTNSHAAALWKQDRK